MPDEPVKPQSETATDIVYDDDPVEAILWGSTPEPTPASIFAPAHKLLEELTSGQSSDDPDTILTKCAQFLQTAPPLTPAMYERFCRIVFAAAPEGPPSTNELTALLQEMMRVYLAREAKGELPRLLLNLLLPDLPPDSDALRIR